MVMGQHDGHRAIQSHWAVQFIFKHIQVIQTIWVTVPVTRSQIKVRSKRSQIKVRSKGSNRDIRSIGGSKRLHNWTSEGKQRRGDRRLSAQSGEFTERQAKWLTA